MLITILALLVAQAPPAPADPDAAALPTIEAAKSVLQLHHPQQALDLLAPLLDGYAARLATEKRRVYCGMSGTEALLYMSMAAKDRTGAVAIGPAYCDALYFKGYALIDLGRIADARAVYMQLATLAPMHAHFASELGQSYRPEKNWPAMLERCTAAAGMTTLTVDADQKREKLFAWHCQGFALTELGRLDESEKLYLDCLALDPLDTHARQELTYIAEQRAKRGATAPTPQ